MNKMNFDYPIDGADTFNNMKILNAARKMFPEVKEISVVHHLKNGGVIIEGLTPDQLEQLFHS